jgi:hypothetical protein
VTGLAPLFVYGMWVALVYRRWNVPGLLAALVMILLVGGYATIRGVTV